MNRAADLARRMQERAAAVEPEFRKTTTGLARDALRYSKQQLSEIYAIPEDLTSAGEARRERLRGQRRQFRPRRGERQWVRTGHLRRSEQVEVRDAYTLVLFNTAVYAEPRHEAGKPNRRKINPVRRKHWRDETVAVFDDIRKQAHHLTVLAILKKGLI